MLFWSASWLLLGFSGVKSALDHSNDKIIKTKFRSSWTTVVNFAKVFQTNIKNNDLWCLISCFIFALIGMTYHYYFFVFCLIVFIIYFDILKEIVLAIWVPRKRIQWTVIIMMTIIFIYSVLSFIFLRNDYSQNILNSWDYIFNCYVTIVDQWYKNHGLGAFLSTNVPAITQNGKFNINWGRFSFDLIFFILVQKLLIIIIFGIIIDNFAERRTKRDHLKECQRSQCFVCGKLTSDIEELQPAHEVSAQLLGLRILHWLSQKYGLRRPLGLCRRLREENDWKQQGRVVPLLLQRE